MVIMERNVGYTLCYGADMKCLFQLLLNREKDVVEVHKLLGRMFNCIFYRRQLYKAETPESESIARWNIDDADNALREIMSAWCLLDADKALIWSLVKRTI